MRNVRLIRHLLLERDELREALQRISDREANPVKIARAVLAPGHPGDEFPGLDQVIREAFPRRKPGVPARPR